MPGLYYPRRGETRFLVNMPGPGTLPGGRHVGDALGLPAHLINDARAFGLAELRLGAGRGASSMVGLTLGTGIGGVFAVDGRVHQGHDGTAGELGHQTIDPDGPLVPLRQQRLSRGIRPRRPARELPAAPRPRKRRSNAHMLATRRRWPGWRRSAGTWASESRT